MRQQSSFLEKLDAIGLERYQFAALRLSDGSLDKLESAISLAQTDWRDLLMAAGFGYRVDAYKDWEPRPAGAADESGWRDIETGLQQTLQRQLAPIGFLREGEAWLRHGMVRQSVTLLAGLRDRERCVFFVEIEFKSPQRTLRARLPRLGGMFEQGYRFGAGLHREGEIDRCERDVAELVPWLQRFGTPAELELGFTDSALRAHLMVEA